MFTTLHKYLVLHKQLNIPSIGAFIIDRSPVNFDYANRQLHAAIPIITFKPQTTNDHPNFYKFLATDLEVPEADAADKFKQLSETLREDIINTGTALLPGIGELKKEMSDKVSFYPSYDVNNYFPVVTAQFVIRKDAQHTIRVGEDQRTNTEMHKMLSSGHEIIIPKDKWRIWAILLMAAGIAALLYHHLFR